MRLLNLFSGTDSVATPWRENNHEVISVDIDPRYNPEICDDILQLDYKQLPPPDVIWPVTSAPGAGPELKHLET